MKNIPFKFFPKNLKGRDFVVGDIHGMFSTLEVLLRKVNFDPKKDRVFSVGDLIDRGTESERAIEFLEKPWFFSILGNHERILLDSEYNPAMFKAWTENNGGEWWLKTDENTKELFKHYLSQLPIAFQIETYFGQIGMVHADIPLGLSWSDFIHNLREDFELREYALWSRTRYKALRLTGRTSKVEGVKLLIFGHTPLHKPLHIENLYYLDTGAAYINERKLSTLSLLQIQPYIHLLQSSTYVRRAFSWIK